MGLFNPLSLYNIPRVVRRKNVYFGPNSVAKISLPSGNPSKVDTADDLVALIYAFAIDVLTAPGKGVLTHYESADGKYVVLAPATRGLINGRAKVLHKLVALVKGIQDPKLWHQFISKLTFYLVNKQYKNAWDLLYKFAVQTGTLPLLLQVKQIIEKVKSRPRLIIRR